MYVTFVINSESSDKLLAAKNVAIDKSQLTRVYVATGKAANVEIVNNHLLRDYFDSIQVDDIDSTSFQITFEVKSDAGGFWKDLGVDILRTVRDSGVSVKHRRKS